MVRVKLKRPDFEHRLFPELLKAAETGTLIVFGSVADRTETGFSDVDLLWIYPDDLPKRYITNTFMRLSKVILKYDHLQHHGPFISSGTSIKVKSPLPPEAIKNGVVLRGKSIVEMGGWSDGRDVLIRLVNSVKRLSDSPPNNLYDLKSFMSWLFLIPTLSFRVKGVYLTKPEAIYRVEEISDHWHIIEIASYIRKKWIRPRSLLFSTAITLTPNPWRINNHLARIMFRIPEQIRGMIPDDFWEEANGFAQDALRFADR